MYNPFDKFTEASVKKPITAILIFILIFFGGIFLMVNYISADVSRSSFYPENDVTRLLTEIDNEYNEQDLDLLRALTPLESNGLDNPLNWEKLAKIEAIMMSDNSSLDFQEPIFGGQSVAGPASLAMIYSTVVYPEETKEWIEETQIAFDAFINALENGNNSEINDSLNLSIEKVDSIPLPPEITSESLKSWKVNNTEWVNPLIDGINSTKMLSDFDEYLSSINLLVNNNSVDSEIEQKWIYGVSLNVRIKLNILNVIQEIDFAGSVLGSIPTYDEKGSEIEFSQRTSSATIGVINLAISTSDLETEKIIEISKSLENNITTELSLDENSKVIIFGFNRFTEASASASSKESPMLTSLAILLLGIILWTRFRSIRETMMVITCTALTIPITFGVASYLFKVTFNPAMFSIPVLVLAIGVDYGLHVVARYREEAVHEARKVGIDEHTQPLSVLEKSSRKKAILNGSLLTSAALIVAITTDVVGFMSFNISNQKFLRDFGTTIAIGLLFVYLSSITVLPALLSLIPPKSKTVITRKVFPISNIQSIEETSFSKFIGNVVDKKAKIVWIVVILMTIPMLWGMTLLKPGFDTRDQLVEDEEGVVGAFVTLNDQFASSPSPIYFIIDSKENSTVLSPDGLEAYYDAMNLLSNDQKISDDITSLWTELTKYSINAENATFSELLTRIEAKEDIAFTELSTWILENEEGFELASPYLSNNQKQMVIRFQAAILDWEASVELEENLNNKLSNLTNDNFTYAFTGDDLIIGMVTEEISTNSVVSTAIVSVIILIMLITINFFDNKDPIRGVVMALPLFIVVCWVYGMLGLFGFLLNAQVVTIGALTLGLGVDYSVHFGTRMEEEAELNPNGSIAEWTSKTVCTTGRAMGAAALTTAGGFSVLLLSSLEPLKLMGISFAIAISMALISSLTLLPTLLGPRLKKHSEQE
ncbi:MAG: Trehalose monomycolate exporter MmpL3 [Methanobacteriota archaeon]|nr:MAG: Trehalose monomycolate exporter MmpL3 [Euryarchaeota archaeon]